MSEPTGMKSPEIPKSPETNRENLENRALETETDGAVAAEKEPTAAEQPPVAGPAPVLPQAPTKDADLMRVERALEDGLGDVYVGMPKEARIRFKQKGEQVAATLRVMLDSAKVNAKKVLQLIREWLKLIPGVNKFFLEQEAKIKTDRILELAEQRKKDAAKK